MEQQLLKEAEDGETFNTRLMIQVLPDTGLKPMQTRTLNRENTYPLIKSRHATPNTIHKEQPPPDLSERKKKPVPLPRHKIGPSPHASNNKTLNNEGSSTPFPKYSCINSKSTSAASEMLHINDDDDNEGIGHDWVIIPDLEKRYKTIQEERLSSDNSKTKKKPIPPTPYRAPQQLTRDHTKKKKPLPLPYCKSHANESIYENPMDESAYVSISECHKPPNRSAIIPKVGGRNNDDTTNTSMNTNTTGNSGCGSVIPGQMCHSASNSPDGVEERDEEVPIYTQLLAPKQDSIYTSTLSNKHSKQ